MPNNLDLEPIRARLAAATPGLTYPFANWPLRPNDAALIANAPADLAAVVAEVERLRRDREVDQAQLRAWGKALEWYAAPANWIENVDDRGRETLRWRWADDDGRMARHALDCWRQSEGAKVLRRADSSGE